jgi:hypothetical protein
MNTGWRAATEAATAEPGARSAARKPAPLGSVADRDEASLPRRLAYLRRPGNLVLLNRAFHSTAFLAEVAAISATPLVLANSARIPSSARAGCRGSHDLLQRHEGVACPADLAIET